uniref:Uncharacterized protein n=1 Tax=Anguilla anguilla TaxID=7936 RepID=A0A0E9QK57_ANGAN
MTVNGRKITSVSLSSLQTKVLNVLPSETLGS